MAIYRGAGGAGDATADSASEALLIRQLAAEVVIDAAAAEAARVAAVAAQAAAELAETNAETAETNAETAEANAETAEANAETAQAAAEAAQAAAETAQTAAELAETNAETAETNAEASATAAASSASAASTSASNAATSATNASNSASAASTSATNAANSATSASTSATTATTQATNASNSATAAATSATNAANSATSASTSASTATTQAGIATTQATNASNSASAASTSATNASNSASAAATSATNAATSATNASNSATSAATSATNAANSFDAFDDRYLGNKTSAPSLDNDGNALINGALYFDTTLNIMRVYSTTGGWQSITNALASEPVRHSVRPSLLLDFANTKTLDPRITFTRASTGTFYDGKTVAKAEENLLVRSQELENAAWGRASITSVTANTSAAPDGTTTAETVVFTGGGTASGIFQTREISSGFTYTQSVFCKYVDQQWIQLTFNNARFGSTQYANFDVQNGVLGDVSGGTASIINAGNGWYRCAFTATSTGSGAGALNNPIAVNNGTATRSATLTASETSVLLWGAQTEQRSSVTAYTATTTAPITNYIPALQTAASGVARFEHNPVTGESLGLEIEEQRTNLLLRSEEFDNAYWTKTKTTVVPNTAIAPDGTLTADLVHPNDSSTTAYGVGIERFTGGQPSATRTSTIYIKSAGWRWVYYLDPSGAHAVWFDLQNGVIGTQQGTATGKITPVGNGWFRLEIFRNQAIASFYHYLSFSDADNSTVCTSNFTSGVFLWGAQTEAGSFATSYIPTVASQVTRSADAAQITGTNFSNAYNISEGTLTAAYRIGFTSGNRYVLSVDQNVNNYIEIAGNNASNRSLLYNRSNGTLDVSITGGSTAVSTTSLNILASAFKTNDFAHYLNGVLQGTDTSAVLVPTLATLEIGRYNEGSPGGYLNGTIAKVAYYPKRLTNAELAGITTI
jgi:hypothetical protein